MKKFFAILGDLLTVLIILFALCITAFTIVTVRTAKNADAGVFGWLPYIVLSDSMQDTFAVGDIIVSRRTAPEQVQPGDIITFRSSDPANAGQVVSHKVRAVNADGSFTTYGTTTGDDDVYPAQPQDFLGKYVFRLPGLGYFFQYLKTPLGYVTVILIPFLAVIGLQLLRFWYTWRRLHRLERRAQQNALEQERRKTRAMQAELERLRARQDQN